MICASAATHAGNRNRNHVRFTVAGVVRVLCLSALAAVVALPVQAGPTLTVANGVTNPPCTHSGQPPTLSPSAMARSRLSYDPRSSRSFNGSPRQESGNCDL